MRRIKLFENFVSETTITPEQKDFLDAGFSGREWTLSQDGLVISDHAFNFSGENLKDLMGIKFGPCSYFDISNNLLTSLEGCPPEVRANFRCNNNRLETLKGAPEYVGRDFDCSHNQLKTLVGGPSRVVEVYDCSHNMLKDLVGLPKLPLDSLYFGQNEIVSLRGITSNNISGGCNGEENPLSEEAIHIILPEMLKEGYTYDEALIAVWDKLNDDDKAVLYPEMVKELDKEEIERLKMVARYKKVRHVI